MNKPLLFIWLVLLSMAASLHATQIPVTTFGDIGTGSLREAFSLASDGDTIAFSSDATIFLQSYILVTHDVYLIAPEDLDVQLSTGGSNRIFDIANNKTLYLEHLTLRDGKTSGLAQEGGGAIRNSGILYATDCLFLNNQAEYGGAIDNVSFGGDTSRCFLERCSFVRNSAVPGDGSTLSIPNGGAIYADTREGGLVEIKATNCTFSGNYAAASGGAFFLREIPFGRSIVSLTHCTFAYNSADNGCGGIHNDIGRFPKLLGCIVSDNEGDARYPNIRGTYESLGNNLLQDTLDVNFRTPVPSSDLIGESADLVSLAKFTARQWLHATTCSSPCNEHIVPSEAPATDQRGEARDGMAEIGAYERVESKDLGMTNLDDSGLGSLRFLIEFHCSGDTLHLPNLSDTIFFQSPILIDRPVAIAGNDLAQLWLHGQDSTRLFEITSDGALYLEGLTLYKGHSGNYGGGAILNRGELTLSHASLLSNRGAGGGAVANYPEAGDTAIFRAVNSTFSHNMAEWLDGGAVDNRSFGGEIECELEACTFVFNEAYVRGGAIYDGSNASLRMTNTILDRNLAPTGEQMYGDIDQGGYNLLRNPEGILSGMESSDVVDIPSNVYPLGNYGGRTLTHALPIFSVAVDAGDPAGIGTATDQRGLLRTYGGRMDIGAVEFQGLVSKDREIELPGITIYPNPGKTFIVELKAGEGATHLILSNLAGQEVWRDQFDSDQTLWHQFTPDLPSGTYLLQVRSELRTRTFRLIIS